VLHAYSGSNLATEYYNSSQAASGRDQFGPGNKFMIPTVANGQVFVGTPNGIVAFGELPQVPVASKTYQVTNQYSTLVLDDPNASSSSGTQMVQSTRRGFADAKWVFTPNGSYYTIRNVSSGLYLADPNGSSSPGTPLEQLPADGSASQLWSLTRSGSGYVIRNQASGLAIEDSSFSLANSNAVDLGTPSGNSNQAWLLIPW
jgi:hypothetical protein